jgi:hypothetical protein
MLDRQARRGGRRHPTAGRSQGTLTSSIRSESRNPIPDSRIWNLESLVPTLPNREKAHIPRIFVHRKCGERFLACLACSIAIAAAAIEPVGGCPTPPTRVCVWHTTPESSRVRVSAQSERVTTSELLRVSLSSTPEATRLSFLDPSERVQHPRGV